MEHTPVWDRRLCGVPDPGGNWSSCHTGKYGPGVGGSRIISLTQWLPRVLLVGAYDRVGVTVQSMECVGVGGWVGGGTI